MKIAITGGIGSGKSTVSNIIKEEGYVVFSCDAIYAELLCDKSFADSLADVFGAEIFLDGILNRKKLSDIVFNDVSALQKLNELSHPAVIKRAIGKMEGLPLSFCEVPLLFENGYENMFDGIIVVLRDTKKRINSVIKRDNLSVEEIEARIKAQFDYDNNNFTKYYVIHNDNDLTQLRRNTLNILNDIKRKLF